MEEGKEAVVAKSAAYQVEALQLLAALPEGVERLIGGIEAVYREGESLRAVLA